MTRFELTKRILVTAGLGSFLLLGLVLTRSSPTTGWLCVLVFGVMTTLSAYDLFTLRDHKIVKGEGTRVNIRSSLVWSGTIIVSIFLGVLILSGNAVVQGRAFIQ